MIDWEFMMDALIAFATGTPFTKKEIERNFWKCLYTRCSDRAFHFSLVLPQNWNPVEIPADVPTEDQPIRIIALFRTIEEPQAEVEVTAILLKREVDPADLLTLHVEGSGEQILNQRRIDSPGGKVADILSQIQTADGLVVSRWFAIKDGKRLFLVQVRTKRDNYSQFADIFFIIVAGFEPLYPTNWPLAESLRTFSRRNPSDFLLFYPESWELVQDSSSNENALILQITNPFDGEVLGKMMVAVIAYTAEPSAQQLVDNYTAELTRGGIGIGQLQLQPAEVAYSFETAWEALREVEQADGTVEVRVAVGKLPDAWFLVGLLGPSRQTFPDLWLINKRAFDIVLQYLKTPTKSTMGDKEVL